MSATVRKTYNHTLVAGAPGADLLERFGLAELNGSPSTREMGFAAATNRILVRTATATESVAYLSDLNQFGRYRGSYDASSNTVPTTAALTVANGDQAVGTPINAGDEILISVAGTIAGLATGSGTLQVGDILKAIIDNATTAAHFIAIERNQPSAAALQAETVAIANLPADTSTAVTLTGTYTRLKSWVVLDSTGVDITSQIVVTRPTITTLSLLSSTAIANIVVEITGLG